VRGIRRAADSVTLVAVSKTFGVEAIEPVIVAGQRVFGENRVQEAKAKCRRCVSVIRASSAPDRPAAIQQGEGGGRAVRLRAFARPAEPAEALARRRRSRVARRACSSRSIPAPSRRRRRLAAGRGRFSQTVP